MLFDPKSFTKGFDLQSFALDPSLAHFLETDQWNEVDAHFKGLTKPNGRLFQYLSAFYDFKEIEFIISIRDASNDWEEDGIWHDDGSRVFAFSISLTHQAGQVEGGHLEIRKKDAVEISSVPTPEYGGIILFLTGIHGFEHRTRQVLKGRRVVVAGWCR